jgi:hypothetical protein
VCLKPRLIACFSSSAFPTELIPLVPLHSGSNYKDQNSTVHFLSELIMFSNNIKAKTVLMRKPCVMLKYWRLDNILSLSTSTFTVHQLYTL